MCCTGFGKAGGKIRWYDFEFRLRPPSQTGEHYRWADASQFLITRMQEDE